MNEPYFNSDHIVKIPSHKGLCISCNKELEVDENGLVYDAGFITLSFHYGSRHDQMKGFEGGDRSGEGMQKLLGADKIEGYLCDDCFKDKWHFFSGYMIEKKETKII